MRTAALSLFFIAFAAGCAPDCERLPDARGGCPWGCVAVEARGADLDRGCVGRTAPFRCVPEGNGWTDDVGCVVRRSDGLMFSTSSGMHAYEDALFRACTQADRERAKGVDLQSCE